MNTETKDGGPAFPCDTKAFQPCTGVQVTAQQFYGMSMRDYFAGQALAGYRANSMLEEYDTVAEWAYGDADAMLKAREQKE